MTHKHVVRYLCIVVAVVLCVAYLYLSSLGKIAVDDSSKIVGLANQIRETLQGKGFWENQRLEVNKELALEIGEPKRNAELNREIKEMDQEFDRVIEQMYRENPEMRPSASERKAEALRDQADAIEDAELDRELKQWLHEYLGKLRRIKQLVEAQVNGSVEPRG